MRWTIAHPIPLAGLRAREHPAASLYASTTNKTLTRDINYLRDHNFVRIEDGLLRANVGLMNQFTT